MACCLNVTCFFCTVCVLIGLASLLQLSLGIYAAFVQTDLIAINRLVKTNQFDAYLLYTLLGFIALGIISLLLTLFALYGLVKRHRSLSLFLTVLWVFTVLLNIAICVIALLYYFFVLPQLRSLLVRSLHQAPLPASKALDTLQSLHTCCGIDGKDDYRNLSAELLPPSCCRAGEKCWEDVKFNQSNSTAHANGCYPIVEEYVLLEVWVLLGVAGLCALLQALAIGSLCVLSQRYRKLDEDPKFAVGQLAAGVPLNEKTDGSPPFEGSSQTLEETVEITQI